jgi:hypothetical protein
MKQRPCLSPKTVICKFRIELGAARRKDSSLGPEDLHDQGQER